MQGLHTSGDVVEPVLALISLKLARPYLETFGRSLAPRRLGANPSRGAAARKRSREPPGRESLSYSVKTILSLFHHGFMLSIPGR